jgi:Fic family protein
MIYGDKIYIWQHEGSPHWSFDRDRLASALADVHRAQGHLAGRMHDLGMPLRDQATLRILTEDVIKTSEIEGENLPPDPVRSSIARRLGVDIGAPAASNRHVDGIVDMTLDAMQNYKAPLTAERLFGWHAALFPTGYSGLSKIHVGGWRSDEAGPMQVVSGPIQRRKVHFEAPPADLLNNEMKIFLDWFNENQNEDLVIKAGIAHLWFVTIHPFEDGNGRIARAVCDMILARSEQSASRYYSLSAEIQRHRKTYYEQLEKTQKGDLDLTDWLKWFLKSLLAAIQGAEDTLNSILAKAHFWQRISGVALNERQIKVLNRLLDGFEGKLTSSKWAALTKCSQDTALRDIAELQGKNILKKSSAGGRSTSYELI